MEKRKKMLDRSQKTPAPQLKVRSNLVAGGSLENCQQNLEYWQKIYNQKCLVQ